MNTVATNNSSKISLKLILLFLAAFLAIFIGGLVMEVFANLADSQKAQTEMASQSSTIVIDPKLESGLAKVLNIENNQNLADLKDPFLDRSGISQNVNNSSVGVQRTTSNATVTNPVAQPNNIKPVTVSAKKGSGNQSTKVNSPPNPTDQAVVKKEDTMTRILRRDEDIRLGRAVLPESQVFAIEDLLPVGVVSGGDGQDEILLYSQSADRTLSYPVGTRFHDGWLAAIQKDGSVFGYFENNQTYLKSWVRSIQPRSATTSVVIGSQNQPLVTGRN